MSQSGRCAERLDQLKPQRPCTSPFSIASVISRVPGYPVTMRKPRASEIIEQCGEVARRGAGLTCTDDQLPCAQIQANDFTAASLRAMQI